MVQSEWSSHHTDYPAAAALAFLTYDYFLTIPGEIQYLWPNLLSIPSICVLFARYTTLALLFVMSFAMSCSHATLVGTAMSVLSRTLVSVLLALRVYALYGRSRRVLVSLAAAGLIILGASIGLLVSEKATAASTGCSNSGLDDRTAVMVSVTWILGFAYDSILFLLTAYKTYSFWRRPTRTITKAQPLTALIFRDGLLGYAAMTLCIIPDILSYYSPHPLVRGSLSPLATVASVVSMSRLTLSLYDGAIGDDSSHISLSEFVAEPAGRECATAVALNPRASEVRFTVKA